MTTETSSVNEATGVVAQLLYDKVRRARVCGCSSCKCEAQSFVDWLSASTAPVSASGREVWWK